MCYCHFSKRRTLFSRGDKKSFSIGKGSHFVLLQLNLAYEYWCNNDSSSLWHLSFRPSDQQIQYSEVRNYDRWFSVMLPHFDHVFSLFQAVIWEAPPKSSLLPDSLCPWALRLHLWSHCALLHLQDSPQLLPGSVFFESRDSFEFKQVRHLRRVPILLILSKEPVFGVQKPYTVSLGCNLKQVYKEFPQTRCAWHVRPYDGPLPLTLETLSRGIRREPNFWFFKEKPIRGGNW